MKVVPLETEHKNCPFSLSAYVIKYALSSSSLFFQRLLGVESKDEIFFLIFFRKPFLASEIAHLWRETFETW